jgi:hypothetical protein
MLWRAWLAPTPSPSLLRRVARRLGGGGGGGGAKGPGPAGEM